MVRLRADALLKRMFMNGFIVIVHLVQPGDDVLAPVAPGGPWGAAYAQVHPTTCQVEILRNLAAGLSRSDYKYIARRQRCRVFVLGRVQLSDARRKAFCEAGDVWDVVCASGNDHVVGEIIANTRVDLEDAGIVSAQTQNRYALF